MTDREKPDWDELFKKVDPKGFEDEEEKPKLKMPEEIKKALKCCNDSIGCDICPYREEADCTWKKNADALSYIQKLEAELDAALLDLKHARYCDVCKHLEEKEELSITNDLPSQCLNCAWGISQFLWRGPCEENGGKE